MKFRHIDQLWSVSLWKICVACFLTAISAQAQQGGFSGPGGLPPGVTPELPPKNVTGDKAAEEFLKNFQKARPILEKEGIIVDKAEFSKAIEELLEKRERTQQRPDSSQIGNKFGYKKGSDVTQVPDGPSKDVTIDTLKTRIAALESQVTALKDKNVAQAEVITLLKKRIAELEAGK